MVGLIAYCSVPVLFNAACLMGAGNLAKYRSDRVPPKPELPQYTSLGLYTRPRPIHCCIDMILVSLRRVNGTVSEWSERYGFYVAFSWEIG